MSFKFDYTLVFCRGSSLGRIHGNLLLVAPATRGEVQHAVHYLPEARVLGKLVVHQIHQVVVVMDTLNYLPWSTTLRIEVAPVVLP